MVSKIAHLDTMLALSGASTSFKPGPYHTEKSFSKAVFFSLCVSKS